MNAERLLAHYERIADAPDAIPQLRRLVLDLAVRGKLVPQDANDEPASELLKRIAAEKARQLNAREVRETGPKPLTLNNVCSLPTPTGWVWTTIGAVSKVVMGQSPPGDTYNTKGDGVPLINGPVEFGAGPFGRTVVNQYTTAPTNFCEEGDLLICVRGSTTGRTNIAGFRACIGRGVAAIQSYFDDPFLRLFIWSKRNSIIEMGRGIAFPSVSRKQIEELAFPLPPLVEQRRIVAKLDELMTLVDRLEAACAEREAKRVQFTSASLARFNIPDTDTFRDDACFALDALPALTARADQIKQLRQTILSLAVRGKLGGSSQGEYASVGAFRSLQNGYAFKSGWFSKQGIRLLRNANIGHGWIRWDDTVFLPAERVKEFERFLLNEGDIVLTLDRPFIITGTKVARLTADDIPSLLLQRVGRFVETAPGLSDDYLFIWINSPHFDEQIDPGRSNGVPHISSKQVEAAQIYVPPLPEQRRIVAKVGELTALCDRLEASLATADETRQRLLEALLAEALSPAAECKMEAAE